MTRPSIWTDDILFLHGFWCSTLHSDKKYNGANLSSFFKVTFWFLKWRPRFQPRKGHLLFQTRSRLEEPGFIAGDGHQPVENSYTHEKNFHFCIKGRMTIPLFLPLLITGDFRWWFTNHNLKAMPMLIAAKEYPNIKRKDSNVRFVIYKRLRKRYFNGTWRGYEMKTTWTHFINFQSNTKACQINKCCLIITSSDSVAVWPFLENMLTMRIFPHFSMWRKMATTNSSTKSSTPPKINMDTQTWWALEHVSLSFQIIWIYTRDFQSTIPGNSYFYSLGLVGIWQIYSGGLMILKSPGGVQRNTLPVPNLSSSSFRTLRALCCSRCDGWSAEEMEKRWGVFPVYLSLLYPPKV